MPGEDGVFDKSLEENDVRYGYSLLLQWDKEECMGRGGGFGRHLVSS